VIVLATPHVENTLLRDEGLLGRRRRLGLQRSVEALETSVLLRLAWCDDFDLDAELEEPHR
jgi:hypothetical protein